MVSATSAAGSPDAPPAAAEPAPLSPEVADSVSPATGSRGGIDYAALWHQVDAESARVVVIDLERLAVVAGRAMSRSGEFSSLLAADTVLDRLFPGAESQVRSWASELDSEPAGMVTFGLSPRLRSYIWRLDRKTAVLAVVHHRHGRATVAAGDSATIRLLCESWLAPELQAMGTGRPAQPSWNRVDRRARAAAPREMWGALAALGLATACGIWLAAGGAFASSAVGRDATLAEVQRLARLSDETLVRSLAHSLADRDYGEAQDALSDHLALGQFKAAVLLNERKQVVAHAGLASPPVVGQPLTASASNPTLDNARRFSLLWAGAPIGELVTVAAGSNAAKGDAASGSTAERVVGVLLVLMGLITGARLWRHLHARYR